MAVIAYYYLPFRARFARDGLCSYSQLQCSPGRAGPGQWRALPAASQTQTRTRARLTHACACARMCNPTSPAPASTLTATYTSTDARVGGAPPLSSNRPWVCLRILICFFARASRAMVCALILSAHFHLGGQAQASGAPSQPPTRPRQGHTHALRTRVHAHACVIAHRPHPRQR